MSEHTEEMGVGRGRILAALGAAGALAAAGLPGCGSGTAALVAGSDDSSGGGTTPVLEAFTAANPKTSPCELLLDARQPVRVALFYDLGSGPEPMTQLEGPGGPLSGNELDLPTTPEVLRWSFASEPGIAQTGFMAGVRLIAMSGPSVLGGGEILLSPGLGNDPPVIESVTPMPTDPLDPSESSGNVEVRLRIRDSSADVVAVRMEWRRASDAPDAWHPATAAGVFPDGIEALPGGVEVSFFWATSVDLADGDDDVLLRATPDDRTLDPQGVPVGVGASVESALFRVDNNEEPIVQLQNDLVVASGDERRGIPVPMRVLDEESDMVELILQWRREGEPFPELPLADPAALDALLSDPAQRRARHVCSAYPRHARGRAVPVDATSLRLPELAGGESWILPLGLEGRTLELLRPPERLAPLTPEWSASPLAAPIAALPLGDGRKALVLDGAGVARLREVELATGTVVRELATLGPGLPSALALEHGGAAALVATDLAGAWRLERIALADGSVSELLVSDGAHLGPVRGLASLGSDTAVLTVGAVLLHLDYRDVQAPVPSTLLAALATPWGVVADGERLYVAEREAPTPTGTGRVLALELDSRASLPLLVRGPDLLPAALERPSALALEKGGAGLLVATTAGAGSQLVRLDLWGRDRNVARTIGAPSATEIGWIACGAEGLRCATLPSAGEILLCGGLEQRRTITAYEPATRRVTLDTPLAPLPAPGRAWRISAEPRPFRASPDGTEATFLWDSAADAGSGQFFLRAVARDAEAGVTTEGRARKRVRGNLDATPIRLGGGGTTPSPNSATPADVDGDGDLDLVTAGDTAVTIFFQISVGAFDPSPHTAIAGSASDVAVADLDGDGDADIALVWRGLNQVRLYLQDPSGTFVLDQTLTARGS